MRILMTTDAIGGVWSFTQELASGLLEHGCAVALVSVGRLPDEQQQHWAAEMERRWNKNRFRFCSSQAPLEWMQENERAYCEAEPIVLHMADDFGVDVLHCNQFCFGALPVSVPKIVTAHSDVLSWADCCRHIPLEDSAWLRQYRLLVCEGLRQADAVIAPTRWMLDALSRNYRLPRDRQVISNGRTVDAVREIPRKLQAVTAGRLWDEGKNIGMLATVVWPMPLVIAGEDRCEHVAAVERFAHAQFTGVLSQDALFSIFTESAIYICCSQYEPFGLAPLEAALCGCAVLAKNIPSLREVWEDGAIYFEDAETLSQVLHALQADTQLLADAQVRSLTRARRYSREAMTSAYLCEFERAMARGGEFVHVA